MVCKLFDNFIQTHCLGLIAMSHLVRTTVEIAHIRTGTFNRNETEMLRVGNDSARKSRHGETMNSCRQPETHVAKARRSDANVDAREVAFISAILTNPRT